MISGIVPEELSGSNWTREPCIAAPQAFYEPAGRAPRIAAFEGCRDGRPTARSIRRVFGSCKGASVAAGIPANRPQRIRNIDLHFGWWGVAKALAPARPER